MKKNKAFTLIELIAVLVILAVISLIVAPLILNTIRRVKDVANMRSIDGYGRAVEYAMANYQLKHLTYPDSFDELEIEYSGNKVECKTSRINPDHTIYLSECKVNGRLVKNDKEFDGYYHYGTLKMTNIEYVDTYGKNLEAALKAYHDEHNEYPSDYTTLTLPPLDKEVSCDVEINCDGTVKLTSCKVNDEDVYKNDTQEYYVYGEMPLATTCLLLKTNSKSITTYTDGNTHEMYTFDHEATEQTPALTDYRYIGNVPYNYVKFNGNETWRIIGIFDTDDGTGEYEKRIKLVRNESIGDNAWNTNKTNDWITSSINMYLNNIYYNSLNVNDKKMIDEIKHYLGGIPDGSFSGSTYYDLERGTTVYSENSINWIGNIALMYPSDNIYTYGLNVDEKCYNYGYDCNKSSGNNNGWIYLNNNSIEQMLIIAASTDNHRLFIIGKTGFVGVRNYPQNKYGTRPTLYLKPEVKIKSGDGTIDNPYEFEL